MGNQTRPHVKQMARRNLKIFLKTRFTRTGEMKAVRKPMTFLVLLVFQKSPLVTT
jgi:hypothetical protein